MKTNEALFARIRPCSASYGRSVPCTPTTAAHVTANISGGSITGFNIVDGGNYPGNPTLAVFIFDSGGGSGAKATATLSGTAVNTVTKITGGSGYTANTYVTVAPTALLSGVSPTVTAVCGIPTQRHLLRPWLQQSQRQQGWRNDPPKPTSSMFQHVLWLGWPYEQGSDHRLDSWLVGESAGGPDDGYVLPSGSNPGVVPTIVNRGSKFNFYAHAYTFAATVGHYRSMNATTTTATVSLCGSVGDSQLRTHHASTYRRSMMAQAL